MSNAHRSPRKQTSGSASANAASSAKLPPSGVPFGHLPAFLPGSASLIEQLDRRIMIVLRDGRHLVGVLRSLDQFSNMVLEDTAERRVLNVKVRVKSKGGDGHGDEGLMKSTRSGNGNSNKSKGEVRTICYYTDIQLGLYLVRGDSMVLLGEVEVDSKDGENSKEEEANMDDASRTNMMGSGLLGGSEKNEAEEQKKYRKEVSLEEFEALVERHEGGDVGDGGGDDGEGAVEQLTWEFDTDLYV